MIVSGPLVEASTGFLMPSNWNVIWVVFGIDIYEFSYTVTTSPFTLHVGARDIPP